METLKFLSGKLKIMKKIPYIKNSGVKKILIVRSARMDLFDDLLEIITAQFPQAEIFALVQESLKDQAAKRKGISGAITFGDGLFKLGHVKPSLVKSIKNHSFDLCVLLLNDGVGRGYFPFRLLLLLTGIPRRIEFNVNRLFKKSGLKFHVIIYYNLLEVPKKLLSNIFFKLIGAGWERRNFEDSSH